MLPGMSLDAKTTTITRELRDAIVAVVRDAVRAELGAALRSPPGGAAPQFLTVKEAMAALSVSRTAFYRLVKVGDLVVIERGRRSLLCADAVRRYADALRVNGVHETGLPGEQPQGSRRGHR
jgi:excisionase family DNA binding protein